VRRWLWLELGGTVELGQLGDQAVFYGVLDRVLLDQFGVEFTEN